VSFYFFEKGGENGYMKRKMKIITSENVTLKQGFEVFLDNCKARNLRDATINHYKEAYKSITRFIDKDTLINTINQNTVDDFVISIKDNLNVASQTLFTYVRDLKTILYFFMKMEYMDNFQIKLPKVDRRAIETYTDLELEVLLKRPNTKKCTFVEYRTYVLANFIISTAVRVNSLINIKVKNIDFDNKVVYVNVTKNHSALIIPLNNTITRILKEYIRIRQCQSDDEYLFCTVYGEKLNRKTVNGSLIKYNHDRKIQRTGLHRLRHTAAKKIILAGKNPAILQKILGHSSLLVTQNYVNILVSDLQKEIEDFDILEEFNNQHIKINKK
jgi:integrase/recombinase XerD